MPFPETFEKLEAAGYRSLRMEVCPDCHLSVEVYRTPAKREIAFQPMCNLLAVPVPHYQVCKPEPMPASKADLAKQGWKFQARTECFECKRAVESWMDRQGEPVKLECMMGDDWPVVLHRCRLVQSRTDEFKASEATRQPVTPSVPQTPVLEAPEGRNEGFKMYGVSDPNHQLLAVGYEPVDRILRCRFQKAEYDYRGVPEDLYLKLRRVPFAYRQFRSTIKDKFSAKKVA